MSQNENSAAKLESSPATAEPAVQEKTSSVTVVVNESEVAAKADPSDAVKEIVEESVNTTPAASVNVVLSQPKTTEELIAARALKRAARKTAVHEKAEGHKRAGDLLFEAKKYKAAYPHYLEATQLWSSNPEYFISLAGAYRKIQWYEEAAYAATRALTLDPKNSEARYVRGVARMEQRLLKPAQIDFQTVLEHDPLYFRARAALTEVNHFIETSAQLGSHALAPNPVDELTKDLDFSFPHYDHDALEIASVSDSSDCNHVGNGVQCRFYNHEGCARGNACTFSHAPDEKSVRDDLGRNVCTYFLLDSCKFGAAKCIYSHSKEALPKSGWWTTPEQIAKAKEMLAVAEKKNREQRQIEAERWKAYTKAVRGAGRPPKSAGIKGPNRKEGKASTENAENVPTDVAADTDKAKQSTGESATETKEPLQNKKSQGQRRKSQARGKKSTPAPSTNAAEDILPTAEKVDPPVPASFTDYQLNVASGDVNPDTLITLTY